MYYTEYNWPCCSQLVTHCVYIVFIHVRNNNNNNIHLFFFVLAVLKWQFANSPTVTSIDGKDKARRTTSCV